MKVKATLGGRIYWSFSCSECGVSLKDHLFRDVLSHPKTSCQHSGRKFKFPLVSVEREVEAQEEPR